MIIKNSIKIDLKDYVINQLNNFFPDKKKIRKSTIEPEFKRAYERSLNCFKNIKTKYFDEHKNIFLNSDKYVIFLYYLSFELYKSKKYSFAEKVYYLNKVLNGIDLFYEVIMPDVFYLVHPVGTVLGRAKYENFFVAYQNCTVGSNKKKFPTIGKNVTMRPGSSILGNSKIYSNCEISVNSTLLDYNLKMNSIYIGTPKKFSTKKKKSKNTWF
jgi:serine O-acetyltransferase